MDTTFGTSYVALYDTIGSYLGNLDYRTSTAPRMEQFEICEDEFLFQWTCERGCNGIITGYHFQRIP